MKEEAEKHQLRSIKCRVNAEYSYLIARCRYNDCFPKSSHRYQLVARNRINDEQKGFFSMHSHDYEKRILKPTTCLSQVEVFHFVQSFGYLGYQRQVDFNQVTCSIDDLEKHVGGLKSYAGLGDLLDIKSRTRKKVHFLAYPQKTQQKFRTLFGRCCWHREKANPILRLPSSICHSWWEEQKSKGQRFDRKGTQDNVKNFP